MVHMKVYTESALMLTADNTSDMIVSVEQSIEGIDSDCEAD